MTRLSRCTRILALAALTGAAACADPLQPPAPTPEAAAAKAGADVSATALSRGFRRAVTAAGVRAHQAVLQEIADAHGGLRDAGGSGGYEASLAYVEGRLAAAGYQLAVQEFPFSFTGDRTPPTLARVAPAVTFVHGVDFTTMSYSGSGDVTAALVAVDLLIPAPGENSSTSGCEAADFAGFPAGSIALVQRGSCDFRVKAANALAAGAAGVVVMNEGNTPDRTGLLSGTLNAPQMSLPVVGTTFALGNELRNGVLNGSTGVTVRLRTDVVVDETRTGRNLVAETPGGDPSRVVIVGVRLDGGLRGPGINQASGAAAALHLAEVFAAQERTPRNKLRLVFTGAGASGLGLDDYLASLGAEEKASLAAAIGLDAVGSPNFVPFVYDGDASDVVADPALPAGSGAIEALFTAYFAAEGLPSSPAEIPPGAETIAFVAAGVPVGGVYGGTFEVKTAAQEAVYGGTTGIELDPCHNLACDTFANASLTALDQLSDAAAHVILVLTRRNFAQEPLVTP